MNSPVSESGGKLSRSRVLVRPIAALASGVALALLFPPFGFGGLVWVALLPLLAALWTLGGRCGRRGFGLGWMAGFTFFLVNLHWLTTVTSVGWVVLSAYLALYPALWAMFAAKWANPWRVAETAGEPHAEGKLRESSELPGNWAVAGRSLAAGFAVAAVWCLQEWLRGWVFTGFGWNPVGVAFHRTPVIAQSADLLGAVGLSFLPVFLQAVLLQTGRRMLAEARAGRMRAHADFGIAALLVALAFCYGVWRIHSLSGPDSIRLKALLVQLNVPQVAARQLWSTEQIHLGYEDETIEALEAISDDDAERFRAADGGTITSRWPDWVVWPESSLDGRVLRSESGRWGTWQQNLVTIGRVREQGDFTLLLGLTELEAEDFNDSLVPKEDGAIWNSLVVLPNERDLASAPKHHLVIFGEYIPLIDKLPFLRAIYEQQAGVSFGRSFTPGDSFEPLPVEVKGEEVGVLPSICFEDTVPRLMRKFLRGGPQLIVNVTNDGWFKESPAAEQHFANARFRSIELRRPMIRCANTGVSAAVNVLGSTAHPDGGEAQEIRDETGGTFTRDWMLAEVDIPRKPATTLYALIGDWGVIGLGVLGLLVGARIRRGRIPGEPE